MANKYKSATSYYTKALFYEPSYEQPGDSPMQLVFTLNAEVEGLINFGREYVADMDTTGYTTANRLLDGYPHLVALMKAGWFRDAREKWDEEIEAKLRSEAMEAVRRIARSGDKNALQAAKFLAAQGHTVKSASTRGRPTKTQIDAEIKEQAKQAKTIEDDMARIGNIIPLAKKA